ncbi:hypothetical protein [Hansschlegelia plantiphila]|uniref:Urease accessory protein UreE n=1 Tax=Hansschlegelia plantiphila TaxID=374655 RepID=A0A9W6J015_9HYPH|nr:hypothetical protein [Hansschlegelia plantiphila]GLK66923.1 hypothetical protein GCM10008179_05610 [Hansschlegelia plantiphila]
MSPSPEIVTELAARLPEDAAGVEIDPLELTSEERASAHFSARTPGGRLVRVSLPRGVELQDGDVLLRDGEAAVVVRAAAEDLLWLRPRGNAVEWSAACYQLGNLHRPARFLEDGVLTPRDPLVTQMLHGLDIEVERVTRPFVGRRFGAAGAHHHHDHDHGAGHDHDHDAAHGQAAHRHG